MQSNPLREAIREVIREAIREVIREAIRCHQGSSTHLHDLWKRPHVTLRRSEHVTSRLGHAPRADDRPRAVLGKRCAQRFQLPKGGRARAVMGAQRFHLPKGGRARAVMSAQRVHLPKGGRARAVMGAMGGAARARDSALARTGGTGGGGGGGGGGGALALVDFPQLEQRLARCAEQAEECMQRPAHLVHTGGRDPLWNSARVLGDEEGAKLLQVLMDTNDKSGGSRER